MFRNRLKTSVLALLLAGAALSCAPDSRQDSLLGPETTATEVQSEATSEAKIDTIRVESSELMPIDAAQIYEQGYTVITQPPQTTATRTLLGWLIKVVEATIALVLGSDGGVLAILGHILEVPAGAVSEPTLFTMTALQNGYVEVELTATPKSLLSRLFFWRRIDTVQFDVPVELSLTYARATNVSDPSRLKIMRVNPDGRHEILPSTVDPVKKTVTAELDHFSRYCLVSD